MVPLRAVPAETSAPWARWDTLQISKRVNRSGCLQMLPQSLKGVAAWGYGTFYVMPGRVFEDFTRLIWGCLGEDLKARKGREYTWVLSACVCTCLCVRGSEHHQLQQGCGSLELICTGASYWRELGFRGRHWAEWMPKPSYWRDPYSYVSFYHWWSLILTRQRGD